MRLGLATVFCGILILAGCGGSSSGNNQSAPTLPPNANAGGPYTGTVGVAVAFSAAGSSDPQNQPLTYAWNFGDGGTASGVSASHTYTQIAGAASTTYTVSLLVTDTSGLSAQTSTTAKIAGATPLPDASISGVVSTGVNPIAGAHVYLFAANSGAAAGPGIAAATNNASISLESVAETGLSDSLGAFVLTGSSGNFNLSGIYSCSTGQQLYLYVTGGNAGSGANPAATLMAALGACPAPTAPAITAHVSEVSTVAAAWSFGPFATDALHVSSSGTPLALTGIANAFANAANLASLSTGAALATTPAGNGTVPQTEINAIANVLEACVDPASGVAGACSTEFSNALSGGMTGTLPTETATLAINMAHYPAVNTTSLFQVVPTTAPYKPALGTSPLDFTIAVTYSGGGLNSPQAVAIDSTGAAWIPNLTGNSVTRLSPLGAALSGSGGYTLGGLSGPSAVAVDPSGNAWITNSTGNSVTEISPAGAFLSGSGYTGGGLNHPLAIAIDGGGNAWVGNNGSITKLSSTGAATGPITGAGIGSVRGIAVDGAGNVWAANLGNSVSEVSNTGFPGLGSPFTGGSLSVPAAIAIDAAGNVWVTNNGNATITRLSHTGVALSGPTGYTGGGLGSPFGIAIDGAGIAWNSNQNPVSISSFTSTGGSPAGPSGYTSAVLNTPAGTAIDGSGDLWVANSGGSSVTEFIGVATPVVTPLSTGLATVTLDGSSKLGTRP